MKKIILSIIIISIISIGCVQKNPAIFDKSKMIVFSKSEQKYPIDKMEENCLSDKSSTQEMNDCTFKAIDAWDKEITKYLTLIKSITSKEVFNDIQLSQKNWELYRDSEIAVYNLVQQKQGTMFQNVSAGFKRELVKQKALELKTLYETLMNE